MVKTRLKGLLIALFCISQSLSVLAQDGKKVPTNSKNKTGNRPFIRIPTGNSIRVDGIIESNEWENAKAVDITISSKWTVKVYFKQDERNLNGDVPFVVKSL